MPKFANCHLVLNSRDRVLAGSRGVYNNFTLANPGQNIVQGQMKDAALSEVLFPYDLPNVMPGYNIFELQTSTGGAAVLVIEITPGFYTPTELAAQITATIIAAGAISTEGAGPFLPAELPTCTYDARSNRFTFNNPTDPTYDQAWTLTSPYTFPINYVGVVSVVGKDILSIMGFLNAGITGQIGVEDGLEVCVGGSAPMVFTQYIDICSPTLCQYQFLRDGSTTTLPRRVDLICRLYVEDETSMAIMYDASNNPIPTGTRPFVMHRQFKNQRVMRNTAANAINDVDIQLYDDCGQPLATAWNPREFQITFHVYEADDSQAEANIGYRY
jgi:hypothetical protein